MKANKKGLLLITIVALLFTLSLGAYNIVFAENADENYYQETVEDETELCIDCIDHEHIVDFEPFLDPNSFTLSLGAYDIAFAQDADENYYQKEVAENETVDNIDFEPLFNPNPFTNCSNFFGHSWSSGHSVSNGCVFVQIQGATDYRHATEKCTFTVTTFKYCTRTNCSMERNRNSVTYNGCKRD